MQKIIKNISDYHAIAERLAELLGIGDCLLLQGPLGIGKTTFASILIRKLCRDPTLKVLSPTFALLQIYGGDSRHASSPSIYHYDLYRLKHNSELQELALEEALGEAISIIEWPERLDHWYPANPYRLVLQEWTSNQRRLELFYPQKH